MTSCDVMWRRVTSCDRWCDVTCESVMCDAMWRLTSCETWDVTSYSLSTRDCRRSTRTSSNTRSSASSASSSPSPAPSSTAAPTKSSGGWTPNRRPPPPSPGRKGKKKATPLYQFQVRGEGRWRARGGQGGQAKPELYAIFFLRSFVFLSLLLFLYIYQGYIF